MSTPSPFGGGNFFENLLGDLLKMLATQGPVHWELARQVAQGVASGGQPETNVDPLERIRLEELVRVADLHVADATGAATTVSGRVVTIQPVTRAEWAWHTLEAWRPLLDSLARSLSGGPDDVGQGGRQEGDVGPSTPEPGAPRGPGGQPPVPGFDLGSEQDPSGFLGQLGQVMGPTLLGLQFGAMVGHLAERAMGQYDLPIPRAESDQLMMVPASIAAFATDWSLPLDDVRLWVCLSEVTHHAILGRPHVRARMLELFKSVDVIIAPATPCVAPKLGQVSFMLDGVELPVRANIGIHTQPISFIGLPVVAVPVPLEPMPIGVQIIAAPWREDIALRVAHALERSGVVAAPQPRGL